MAQEPCETGQCPPELNTQLEDPLEWSTFSPPIAHDSFPPHLLPSVVIEFCNRCRWLHRATWVQTELFLTFEEGKSAEEAQKTGKYATAKGLKSIQLIPCNAPETGGRFRVWLYREKGQDEEAKQTSIGSFNDNDVVLAWDRKIKGGFPELKELKQVIRDHIAPSHSLGHSDKQSDKEPKKAN